MYDGLVKSDLILLVLNNYYRLQGKEIPYNI
jgi:hypothetical protein